MRPIPSCSHRRQQLVLDAAFEDRVLALQGRDGMDRCSPSQVRVADLTESDVEDLAGLDKSGEPQLA